MLELLIEKMFEDVKAPVRAHDTDSGFDLYAYSVKEVYTHSGGNGERVHNSDLHMRLNGKELTLYSQERALIGTGIKATVGVGYEIQIRPRSGLALKQGLTVLNTPGTIDEGYRAEIGIIIVNQSRASKIITLGDRIAQLVVAPVMLPTLKIVDKLPALATLRAEGGFGSSGSR